MFRRDPARAQSLRAKAKARMAADDNSLLDKLILQARLADEEDDPTPEDPGQDDPDEPEDPPYDSGHPQPSDPDDPGEDEPDEPEGPEKPKPNKEEVRAMVPGPEEDRSGPSRGSIPSRFDTEGRQRKDGRVRAEKSGL